MPKKKIRILVLAGGPSLERVVSLNTAKMVLKNLDFRKYVPSLAIIGKDGRWYFSGGKVFYKNGVVKYLVSKFDFVFIAMHGRFGEDGHIQAILEWIGLPYSGSAVMSSALAMDKETSNQIYSSYGLAVPRYVVVECGLLKNFKYTFPVVIKPVDGGSSLGVSIVKNKKEFNRAIILASRLGKKIMIQKYIHGREITCGVLEGRDGRPFALPPTEIIPKQSSFFNYQAKYKVGGSLEITPAQLSRAQMKKVQKLALFAHISLGCRGMSRSDFILSGSKFYILETNTIPGMTRTSLLPQSAKVAGISFSDFLELLIVAGFNKFNEEKKGGAKR